jgi:UDP-4-amino-4,6-dideoxy-N-acetyl-beta-L-altrosamine N-acetyltransferase
MIKFIKVREEHLEQILKWRTDPDVNRFMLTDVEYNMEYQRNWFDKISADETKKYWMVNMGNKNIGLINLEDLDWQNRRVSWGYYIGDMESRGVGGTIPPYLYNYIFNIMHLHKVWGWVMEGNDIFKLHEIHGYRIVGTMKDHVYKNNKWHDVHVLEMLRDAWASQRRYQGYVAEFEE